jgi:uncharacterized protein (TIGR02594 family)
MSRIFSGISLALIAGALVVANPSNVGARPNPREVEATRADQQRAAQLRHARERRDAVRRMQPQSVRSSSHRRPVAWPALVTEARKYIGTNPTAMQRRWCARFLNLVLNKTGYRGTGSDAARSFASYGRRINEPRIGAIAVLSRGKNQNLGHVGIVTGVDGNGNPVIISGNHGRRVAESTYPRSRVIAYVMPADGPPMTQIAAAGPSSSQTSADLSGLPAPIAELLAAINSEASARPAASVPALRPAPQPTLQLAAQTHQRVRGPVPLPTARPVAAKAFASVLPKPRAVEAVPQPKPAPYRIVQQLPSPTPMPDPRRLIVR